jgi:hypothetical protein
MRALTSWRESLAARPRLRPARCLSIAQSEVSYAGDVIYDSISYDRAKDASAVSPSHDNVIYAPPLG